MKKCKKCHAVLESRNFFKYKNKELCLICKNCINKEIYEDENNIYKWVKEFDIPFIEKRWEEVKQYAGEFYLFSKYYAIMNLAAYKVFGYNDSKHFNQKENIMKKIKIIALFGPAGAGKDALQEIMVEEFGWHGIISHTTRPIRDNEKEGVAYHFITRDEFEQMVEEDKFLETTDFNNWYYGTSIDSLSEDEINIGVFNIDGIKALLSDSRVEVTPIYICVPDKMRLERQLNREQNPNCLEICRRFLADDYDFKNKVDFEYNLIMNDKLIYHAVADILALTKND